MTMKKIRLFCFPHAGGSAASYNKWRLYMDKHIELIPLELAGRGRRVYDPLYNSIDEAIDDILKMIKSDLGHGPYAFFGHSMGAIMSYETALKIRQLNYPEPIHIFQSGRGAPDIPDAEDHNYHLLPEEEFKTKIVEMGGTPKEFFEHPELMEMIMPMLRSDFKLAETYRLRTEVMPFDYDLSVMVGKDEDVTAEQMFGWRKHTKKLCTLYYFEGEHFFLNDEVERVVSIINHTLLSLRKI